MKKKWLAIALSMVMAVGLMSGCGSDSSSPAGNGSNDAASSDSTGTSSDVVEDGGGKKLNIYAWNDNVLKQLEAFCGYKDGKIGDVEVNLIQNAQADNVFTDKLTEALSNQESAAADDKVDLVLLDAGFAKRYTSAAADVLYTMPEIGITDADVADLYDSNKRLSTDENGQLRALGFQATGCGVFYRADYAKEALGTDDPKEVQDMMSSWDGYLEVAEKLKAKGIYMIDSPIDLEYVYVNDDTTEIGADNKIAATPGINSWLDFTKDMVDKGYVKRPGGKYWEDDWFAGATQNGKVFMYSGPGWFLNGCLAGWTGAKEKTEGAGDYQHKDGKDSYGNWRAITGPQAYWWGGTYFGVAKGSDNTALCADIIKNIVCNEDNAYKQFSIDGSFPANKKAAQKLVDEGQGSDVLGGQNVLEVYAAANDAIGDYAVSPYDTAALEGTFGVWADFFTGKIDKETVISNWQDEMIKAYPNLEK